MESMPGGSCAVTRLATPELRGAEARGVDPRKKLTKPVGVAVVPADADFTTAVKVRESPAEIALRDDVRDMLESALAIVTVTGAEVLPLKSASPL